MPPFSLASAVMARICECDAVAAAVGDNELLKRAAEGDDRACAPMDLRCAKMTSMDLFIERGASVCCLVGGRGGGVAPPSESESKFGSMTKNLEVLLGVGRLHKENM